ncbi:TPA: hypothetical protein ACGOZH_001589 [Streptococcus suis]|uniref:hypothetical protein n=1 Tax=Streptococcus parasuis TaxID=1501662 RepID=UPI002412A81D|nr:hypothetical protein [Streptococcus parasuis]MDG4477279.1 hypothetical protein [Streptococcus parasuis]
MKKNLDEARRDYFDFELQAKHLKIDKLINNRKRDLLQNYEAQNMNMKKFDDMKVRGGSYTNHAEDVAVAFASDPVVLKLEEFQKCVDELLIKLEPDDRKIFELRWGYSKKDWTEIFEIMSNGDTGFLYRKQENINKRREIILDNFTRLLGY